MTNEEIATSMYKRALMMKQSYRLPAISQTDYFCKLAGIDGDEILRSLSEE